MQWSGGLNRKVRKANMTGLVDQKSKQLFSSNCAFLQSERELNDSAVGTTLRSELDVDAEFVSQNTGHHWQAFQKIVVGLRVHCVPQKVEARTRIPPKHLQEGMCSRKCDVT